MIKTAGSCLAAAAVLAFGGLLAAAETGDDRPALEDAQKEAAGIARAYRTERSAHRRAESKARQAGDPIPPDPAVEFVARARAWATEYAGTDAAVPFLAWIVTTTVEDADAQAVTEEALARYAGSEALPALIAAISRRSGDFGAERTRVYLDRILAENKHAEVRAEALLARAQLYFARRPLVKNASKTELDAGRADLRRGLELATAVGGKGVGRQPVAPDQPLVERVDGVLFEAEHLQIGHVAPDIIGKDLDGVEFRLSDYRGNVVMLDFWGHW